MIKFFSIGWKPSETREWQDGRTLVHKWSQGAKLPLQPRPYLNFWFWGLWYSSLVFTTTNNQDYKIISWDLWIIFSIKMLWFFPQFSIDYICFYYQPSFPDSLPASTLCDLLIPYTLNNSSLLIIFWTQHTCSFLSSFVCVLFSCPEIP